MADLPVVSGQAVLARALTDALRSATDYAAASKSKARTAMQPMPVCPGGARLRPFRSCKPFPSIIACDGGKHMAASVKGTTRVLRIEGRRGFQSFTIGVNEDDLGAIANHGYEGAVSTDRHQRGASAKASSSPTCSPSWRPRCRVTAGATPFESFRPKLVADRRARSPRASADHPWSGRIRLDAMFTANASTVALKKNEIAPCRAVSRRIVLLVIWTSDTWAVIATTSE